MIHNDEIRPIGPASLIDARHMTHKAVQMLSNVARANLLAKDDDSHANLGWNQHLAAFVSRPLMGRDGEVFIALNPARLELRLFPNSDNPAALELHGVPVGDVESWLDDKLADRGLKSASAISIPYDMPSETESIATYSSEGLSDSIGALSAWFATAASALSEFSDRHSTLSPSPIRCWAHHYDIATEVNFPATESDEVRTIGVGFSPGDDHYAEPYFYISPWSDIDKSDLPEPAVTGHWHTDGFTGIIATGTQVLNLADLDRELPEFLSGAFALCRRKLGV